MLEFSKRRDNLIYQTAFFITLFVVAVLAEASIRDLARKPIPILVADGLKADVGGNVWPDFLWMGDAWCINIQCGEPVAVELNKQWKARIPAGKHIIFHNHDDENTIKYGTTRWTEVPTIVTVRKLDGG